MTTSHKVPEVVKGGRDGGLGVVGQEGGVQWVVPDVQV